MRNNPFNRLLRSEAHELEAGGGGASSAPAAAAPPIAAPAAAPPVAAPVAAAPPREPTRLEQIAAAFRDKGAILAESAGLRSQVEQLTAGLGQRDATIVTLQAQVKSLTDQNVQLNADVSAIDAALKTTEGKVISIETAATRQLAGMGFEAAALPAAAAGAPTVEALMARMNATTDANEKFKLAAQINKLEAEI